MSEFENTNEQEKPSLEERINKLLQETISVKELADLLVQEGEIVRRWHSGEVSEGEYIKKVEEFNKINKRCQLALESIEELAEALTLVGCENDFIEWTLGHELSHYEEALAQGLRPNYHIRIGADENELQVTPGITASWEGVEVESADLTERIKKVTSAPDELSKGDRYVLGASSEDEQIDS